MAGENRRDVGRKMASGGFVGFQSFFGVARIFRGSAELGVVFFGGTDD